MASIPAMRVIGSDFWAVRVAEGVATGAFPAGRAVTLSAYKIAKYETTYELWYEVKTWATDNGYRFTTPGREGHCGTDGAAPTSAAKTQPVTKVSWRDVVVWCNAYSEMSGKTPAYYRDSACATVIKSLTGDTVYVKPGADGYRLPTEAEWEAAARGGNPSDPMEWLFAHAGSYAIDSVAWYRDNAFSVGASDADYGTHAVGTKNANRAGLYDMSGNVWEWCWDWYDSDVGGGAAADPAGAASGSERVIRGGCWNADEIICAVAIRNGIAPDERLIGLGFRVACAP